MVTRLGVELALFKVDLLQPEGRHSDNNSDEGDAENLQANTHDFIAGRVGLQTGREESEGETRASDHCDPR